MEIHPIASLDSPYNSGVREKEVQSFRHPARRQAPCHPIAATRPSMDGCD